MHLLIYAFVYLSNWMEQFNISMPSYLRKCPWYMHVHSYDFLQALQTQMRLIAFIFEGQYKGIVHSLQICTELLLCQLLLILLCSYCINTSNLIKCIWICDSQHWQIMVGETKVRRSFNSMQIDNWWLNFALCCISQHVTCRSWSCGWTDRSWC